MDSLGFYLRVNLSPEGPYHLPMLTYGKPSATSYACAVRTLDSKRLNEHVCPSIVERPPIKSGYLQKIINTFFLFINRSDLWFYAIDPATMKILRADNPKLKM